MSLSLTLQTLVKAGKSGSLKSLQQFVLRKHVARAVRFDLNLPSRQNISHLAKTKNGTERISYELLSIPLYAVGELYRLLINE